MKIRELGTATTLRRKFSAYQSLVAFRPSAGLNFFAWKMKSLPRTAHYRYRYQVPYFSNVSSLPSGFNYLVNMNQIKIIILMLSFLVLA
jgi:hypothetical protein